MLATKRHTLPISAVEARHLPSANDEEPLMHDAQTTELKHSSSPVLSHLHRHRAATLAMTAALLFLVAVWLLCGRAGRSTVKLSRLLSDDERAHTAIRMIDEAGVYERFHTIVLQQKAHTELHSAYQTAHDLLAARYSRILAPLPVASLHVTLSGVFDQRASQRNLAAYNSAIAAHHERLERVVYAFDHLPAFDPPLAFSLVDVPVNGTGVTLHVAPKHARDQQRLSQLVALAQSTLGPLYKQQARWHMTLANKVPPIDAIAESELAAVQRELRKLFEDVDIMVRDPALCVSPLVSRCDDLH